MNVVLRPEAETDRAAIRRLHQAAFAGSFEANLVDALRDGGYVELSLVAELDRIVIGHLLFSRVTIVTSQDSVPALSLAPIAVVPQLQRQGIGRRLIEAGLQACREHGAGSVLVLGDPAYYQRFGFAAEPSRRIESPFGGGEAWMALELLPGALEGVQGTVEFSPPFLALL